MMRDVEFDFQKERITKVLTYWKHSLGLDHWWIEPCFKIEIVKPEDGLETAAETFPQWEYMSARITFNVSSLAGDTDDRLNHIVVHEFVHCLVAEITKINQEGDSQHLERVVSDLTNAFMFTRDIARANTE